MALYRQLPAGLTYQRGSNWCSHADVIGRTCQAELFVVYHAPDHAFGCLAVRKIHPLSGVDIRQCPPSGYLFTAPVGPLTFFQQPDKDLLTPWPTEKDDEGLETAKLGLKLQLGPDIM